MRPLPMSGSALYTAIFWSVYVLWFVLESVAARSRKSGDSSRARDRGSYWVIIGGLWFSLAVAFAMPFVFPQASIMRYRISVFYAGVGLMLGGLAFRFYAMAVLGRSFTYDVAVRSDQTVVDAGPYRYIRHPSYSGALLTVAGVGLALGNWASFVALIIVMGCAYAYRMAVEEAALLDGLGEPYRQYMLRTRRLVPFIF
jgi:protein-S-isoprenylcysteine O-methyltransferase Ste14